MSIARIGIQRMAIWDKANAKSSIIPLFQRGKGKLTISEKTDLKDYRGRVMPSMVSAKIEAEEYGVALPLLNTLLTHAGNNGVSAEVVGVKTASTPAFDGAYKFLGSNFMGLDFDYQCTGKERKCGLTLEAAYDPSIMDAIILDAATNTYETLSGVAISQYTNSLLRAPGFSGLYYYYTGGSTTALFAKEELKDFKLSIKTVGDKSAYDRTVIRALEISLECTLYKANKTDLLALNVLGDNPSIALVLQNTPTTLEQHTFGEGILSMQREYAIGDDERTSKIMWTGECEIANVTHSTAGGNSSYTYAL